MVADAYGHRCQCNADKGGGQRFVLAVAVVMAAVLGFVTDMDEEQYHAVGEQVGERVYRVGRHGGAVARNAGDELKHRQHHVHHAAHQRYLEDFPFAFGGFQSNRRRVGLKRFS